MPELARVISLEDHRFQLLVNHVKANFKFNRHREPEPVHAFNLICEAYRNRNKESVPIEEFLQQSPIMLRDLLDMILDDYDYRANQTAPTAVACRGIAAIVLRLSEVWEVPHE